MIIVYIPREDNMVADALSRVCDGAFPSKTMDSLTSQTNIHGVNATLSIMTNTSILREIQDRYQNDKFCKRVMDPSFAMQGFTCANNLWYIGDQLIIPRTGTIRKDLFRLVHDNSGHFGVDKSYAKLCDAYYWPNMR
jgi:hypothetical protein